MADIFTALEALLRGARENIRDHDFNFAESALEAALAFVVAQRSEAVPREELVEITQDWIDHGTKYRWSDELMTFLREVKDALARRGAAPQCPWCTRDGRGGPIELELQWVCEHCGFRGTAEDYEKAVLALGGSKL